MLPHSQDHHHRIAQFNEQIRGKEVEITTFKAEAVSNKNQLELEVQKLKALS